MAKKKTMTRADAAKIQSANAKKGIDIQKKSFPARVQSTADKNATKKEK